MKTQKLKIPRYREPVYRKQRITTKEFYSGRCRLLERQIKLLLNNTNLKLLESVHPDRIKNLMEIRIKHKYLNTAWAQAGNYPKEINDFLINS